MFFELFFSLQHLQNNSKSRFLPLVSNCSPPVFSGSSWTRPTMYEIPFRENFSWTGQTAGGE
eukprot:UN24444